MKLLIDNNLSWKLVRELAVEFSGSVHADQLGVVDPDDAYLWAVARDGGYAVLSKDDDFFALSQALGHPPKVLLVALGNCTTGGVVDLLRDHLLEIYAFEVDPLASLLMLP